MRLVESLVWDCAMQRVILWGIMLGRSHQTRGKKEPVDDIVQGDTSGNDSDGDASYSSEDSMENIYFDDSEEDKELGLDDGFSDIDEMTGEKNDEQPESSSVMEKNGTGRIKKKKLKTMKHPVHEATPTDVTPPSQETDSQAAPVHEAPPSRVSENEVAPVDEAPLEHDGVLDDADTEIFVPENVERIHDIGE
ncbi:hypothetical protein SESBI_28543 [Sesbania bispinosa]|nr:hypothetical protein SESBI_28543 [Sesbania bispinosa]